MGDEANIAQQTGREATLPWASVVLPRSGRKALQWTAGWLVACQSERERPAATELVGAAYWFNKLRTTSAKAGPRALRARITPFRSRT